MFTWRRIVLLDQNFLRQKRRYAAQAVLAALTLGVVLAIVETLANVAQSSRPLPPARLSSS